MISSCCDWLQEGRYEDALQKFMQVQHVGGYRPDLAYNIALCQYMLKQYGPAHTCVGDIIARGINEHPGTSSSSRTFTCPRILTPSDVLSVRFNGHFPGGPG